MFVAEIGGETSRSRSMSALRQVISPQINAFRSSASQFVECPILHSTFPLDECDVDHAPPFTFATIVDTWLASLGVDADMLASDISRFELADDYDAPVFIDPNTRTLFYRFHAEHAKLRLISAFANRQYFGGVLARVEDSRGE